MKIQKYGWRRPLPTPEHMLPKYVAPHMAALPPMVDLRPEMPAVYDQDTLGSCTAHATSAILHYQGMKQGKSPVITPSRLAIYYNTRILEGTIKYDSGASIANSVKSVHQWGFCDETLCPYDISKFSRKPSLKVYAASTKNKITDYHSVNQTENDIKTALASGNPITFGFSVFQSFESEEVAKTGIMPVPQTHEQILGGHAVTIVGYDDDRQSAIVRNSWSAAWGDHGYFWMPYSFLLNPSYADDFWLISQIP